jgi:tRNA threonylcarbamoyladenosine biosynthesis protein TsaE
VSERTIHIGDVADMERLGARLATGLRAGNLIYVRGPLGAGKTTLVRGVLHSLGHRGSVKSPTFTLVEPYAFDRLTVYHFDLYRLKDPEELEFMGIRDYLRGAGACLIEWPELGRNVLPEPDLDVMIEPVPHGRTVVLTAHNNPGHAVLRGLDT